MQPVMHLANPTDFHLIPSQAENLDDVPVLPQIQRNVGNLELEIKGCLVYG